MKIPPMLVNAVIGVCFGSLLVVTPIIIDHSVPTASVKDVVQVGGVCYRVNGFLPSAYSTAAEYLTDQPETAAKTLRAYPVTC